MRRIPHIEELLKALASKIITPGDIIATCLGAFFGIILMLYLASLGVVPERFEYFIPIGTIALFLAIKNIIVKVKGQKNSPDELNKKASALSRIFNNDVNDKLPASLRRELEDSYVAWTGQVITDEQFGEKIEEIQTEVRKILIPVIRLKDTPSQLK